MKIIALLDGRPGNDNQTIAVAEKLGDYESLKIEFSFLAKLPNLLLGTSKLGIKTDINNLNPDIIISTGRKLARVAHIIRNNTGCKIFQLMNPQMPFKYFDHIFIPEHDNITGDNITQTIGSPNRVDDHFLNEHKSPIKHLNRIAMLVGDISANEIPQQLPAKNLHITTSRRTKPKTIKALEQMNASSLYIYPNGENPYYSMLATAEKIYVSADSIGMISESYTTGKPVEIFGTPSKSKFAKFIKSLEGKKKLSTRDEVVEKIKKLVEL